MFIPGPQKADHYQPLDNMLTSGLQLADHYQRLNIVLTSGLLLVEIHIYQVPRDRWIERQNIAKTQVVHYAISSGFVRVPPYITLSDLRTVFPKQLCEETLPEHYVFLRRVGRNFTQVKKLQEKELKVKYYMPPYTFDPEIYIKEGQYTKNSRWPLEEDSGFDELLVTGHRSQDDSTSPSDDTRYNLSSGLPSALKNNFLSSGDGSREGGSNGMLTKENRNVAEKSTRCGESVFKGFTRRQKVSNQPHNSRNGSQQFPASTESSAYSTSHPLEVNNKGKQRGSASVKTTEDEKFFKSIQENEEGVTAASLVKNIKLYCSTEAESVQSKQYAGAVTPRWTTSPFTSRVPTRISVELTKKNDTRTSIKKTKSSSRSRVPVPIVLLKRPLSRIGRSSCVQGKGRPNSGQCRVNSGRSRHISGKSRPNSGRSRLISGQKKSQFTRKKENYHNFVENVYKSTNSSGLPRLVGLVQKMNPFISADGTSEEIRSVLATQSSVLQFRKQKGFTTANKQTSRSTIQNKNSEVCSAKNQLVQYSNTETTALPKRSSKIPKARRGNIMSKKASFTISRENERETQCWRRFQDSWRQFFETKNFQDRPWPVNLTRAIQQEGNESKNFHSTNNIPELNKHKEHLINSNVNHFLTEITDRKWEDVSSSHTQLSVKNALLKKGYSLPISATGDDSKSVQQAESATVVNVATLSADSNIKNDIQKQNKEKERNGCYFKITKNVTKKGLKKCNRNREVREQQKYCLESHTDNQINQISDKTGGSARRSSLHKASSSNRTLKTEGNVEYINGIRTFTTVRDLGGEKNTWRRTDNAVTSEDNKEGSYHQNWKGQKNESTVEARITHDNGVEYYDNGALKIITSPFIDDITEVEERISGVKKHHSFNLIVTEEIKENKLARRHSNRDKTRRYSSKDQIDSQSSQVLITKTGATGNKCTSRQSTLDVFVKKTGPTMEKKTRGRIQVKDKYNVQWNESRELIDYDMMGQNNNLENVCHDMKDTDEIPRADAKILYGISLIPKPTSDPKGVKEDQSSEKKISIANTPINHDISNIQEKEKGGKERNRLNIQFTLENKRKEFTQYNLGGDRRIIEGQNYDFEGVSDGHTSEALGRTSGTTTSNSSCWDSTDKTSTKAIRVENAESRGDNKSHSVNRECSNWEELDEQVYQKVLSKEDNRESGDGQENKGSEERIEYNTCPSRIAKNCQWDMYEKVYDTKSQTEEKGKESRETRAYASRMISNNSVNRNGEKARKTIRRPTSFQLRRSRSDSSSLASGRRRQVRIDAGTYRGKVETVSSFDLKEDNDLETRCKIKLNKN
ncbi:uncharacterized protein LOC111085506 [Limulus polyphemus]|uniref:Uncharacterized protein LOC111085506 n=1 Tax=Limulus polyphemus TaxID=6850 RepID=A0ABM1S900_LIMPO|nr:uncharacterized protein LOC111085506 [Limulus polyphemus]